MHVLGSWHMFNFVPRSLLWSLSPSTLSNASYDRTGYPSDAFRSDAGQNACLDNLAWNASGTASGLGGRLIILVIPSHACHVLLDYYNILMPALKHRNKRLWRCQRQCEAFVYYCAITFVNSTKQGPCQVNAARRYMLVTLRCEFSPLTTTRVVSNRMMVVKIRPFICRHDLFLCSIFLPKHLNCRWL